MIISPTCGQSTIRAGCAEEKMCAAREEGAGRLYTPLAVFHSFGNTANDVEIWRIGEQLMNGT